MIEHTLVTGGPYRWVRHSFYDAVALGIVASSLAAANWFILLSGSLAFALIIVRTRTEEEQLVARFGDSYRMYMQHRPVPAKTRGMNDNSGVRSRRRTHFTIPAPNCSENRRVTPRRFSFDGVSGDHEDSQEQP